ncbi:hypothetical protein PRIPAC_90330 [Pristionchus pacificus]|uniref:Protein kinase domain-containing protein n=1 Tax=Pristionchus pacificus TaxID=54126 RepID=A0A2A6CUZ6_PRIPA|nr:hypothetical protein PRIPAC_90330 [Pristionchus pacificus]|eukprot:PDM82005.1 protein kinase [Pristionchus pacificus]
MRRQLEKLEKEEANENGMTEVELENFEPLPEYVECYKLENGAKRFFKASHPQEFYISETYIVTLSRTEFALRQPYFLDVDHRVVQDFEGNTFGLPSGNIALSTATRVDFRFFVCGEIVYFINSGSYEIDIVNRGKFVTIVLEDDMELPESVYAKPNCPIYLMHGNVLMTIKDNLLHKLQYLEFVNDYDVKSIRGHGGFGYVFEAANKHDQWTYAVKRIAVDKEDLERGRREAQSMVRLEHPGIVRYFHSWVEEPPEGWQHDADARLLKSIGWSGDRLLCGVSLANWLENNQEQCSRVPARMRFWLRQIVEAVGYIHDCNMIHRDLKV